MRRLSWRLVPEDERPPSAATASRSAASPPPRTMSVPRPAMLVEIVTAPRRRRAAMMLASSRVLLGVQNLARDRRALPAPSRAPRIRGRWSCRRESACRSRWTRATSSDDRGMLGLAGGEHHIRLVDAAARPMRRKDSRLESEERGKLLGRSVGRRGHAARAASRAARSAASGSSRARGLRRAPATASLASTAG